MHIARSRQRNMRAIGCMQAHLGNSNAKPTIADIMRRSDQFFSNQLPQKIAGALFGIKINRWRRINGSDAVMRGIK